jgi:predicted nucleic-acid-binding protein
MIGLDTNIIVRYITQDDVPQSRAANKLIDSLSAQEPGFIAIVVIAELTWVLQRSYRAGRGEIAKVVESLLQTEELRIERADLVRQALHRFTGNRADFADCLIERCAHAAECHYTATFDREAAAIGMRLLS